MHFLNRNLNLKNKYFKKIEKKEGDLSSDDEN